MFEMTQRHIGRGFGLFAAALAVFGGIAPVASGQCRLGWKFGEGQGLPGVSRSAYVATSFDDGSGEALYVGTGASGGRLNIAGEVRATGFARWNGSVWSAVGELVEVEIHALTVHDDQLIAGGWFMLPGGEETPVIRWDGTAWVSMSEGLTATAGIFGTYQGRLIMSHARTGSNPKPEHWIYEWDGARWNEMGQQHSASSGSFVEYRGELFAEMQLGQDPYTTLARWTGRFWEPFQEVYGGRKLVVHDDKLVVSGVYKANGVAINGIGAWDGNVWTNIGKSIAGEVYDFFVNDGRLYAIGRDLTVPPGYHPKYVAMWDGSEWQQLGKGSLQDSGRALTAYQGDLIAVGADAPGQGAEGIARWDGVSWQPLGDGFNNQILRLGVHGDELFAYGTFGQAGKVGDLGGFARWDGEQWRGVGAGGPNSTIHDLISFGNDLIAVGTFTEIGGVAANRIARWDGSSWSAMGTGADAPVFGATVYNGDLVVVGEFTSVGGVQAEKVAIWDGQQWRQLGSGFDNTAKVAHVHNGVLFVGGDFRNSLAGTWITNITQWDGQKWQRTQALGYRSPFRLASFGGELVSIISRVSRTGTNSVHRWDGSYWHQIGEIPQGHIIDMAVYNDELYISGDFNFVGEVEARRIARWNGIQWRPLKGRLGRWSSPTGLPQAQALAAFKDELIVGGSFLEVDSKVSAHWARWGCVSCYADCDDSTGAGVLDVFDYLCFQSSFVASDPYACDCDTATGPGVCDILDFLCFQDAFVAGCP